MKRYLKVRTKRMLITTGRDMRKEALIFTGMVGTELGTFLQEFLKGFWEGLTGPQKPARRRNHGRGQSW